ncbi:hypothetical protein SLS57_010813 [Botryosphaeria dothidea]
MSSPPKADAGIPFLYRETLKFLHDVAHDPNAGTDEQELWPKLGRYTYSAFAQQTFGLEIKTDTSPSIPYIHETGLAQIIATFPGPYIVDMLQILDKLPPFMKTWEISARARFQRDLNWCREKMKKVKKLISNGNEPDALLSKALKDEKLLGFSCEDEAAYMSLMLIIGAADTSQISTWSFLEAMLYYPDVQEKARQQVDEVSLQSANLPDPTKRDHFAFGAGRRICPGLHIAERSLALAIMRILWAFDIKPKPSAAGRAFDPADYRGGMPGTAGTGLPGTLDG